MSRRTRRKKEKTDKANAEDDESSRQTPYEKLPPQTFEEYECTGNVEIDFPGLCALLDIMDIPAVSTRQPASTTDHEGVEPEDSRSQIDSVPLWSQQCLQVELENEDPLSTKKLKFFGWRVDKQITRVLQRMLPSLCNLQSLQFWQAGLTDRMVIHLMNTISQCSNLRTVTLEGNQLPEQSYHVLLSKNSPLTHLSLRNNGIGDEGARLIGLALSTTKSANKNLVSLNLAFNSIGDAGASHIAQGLRLNRSLLHLSLCNNLIGDPGAAQLAKILGEFALTHEEVVARRMMLLERMQSSSLGADLEQSAEQLPSLDSSTVLSSSKVESKGRKRETSKKDEKPSANKENPKSNKKVSDIKVSQSKGAKQEVKEKHQEVSETFFLNQEESVEIVTPLLDEPVQYRDGDLILPGNTCLAFLNLAGNRITKKSLPLFLTALEMQGEGGGLLRLCLQRNKFPPDSEWYVKIKELMTLH